MRMGPWRGSPTYLAPDVENVLQPDNYAKRHFVSSSTGQSLSMYVGLFRELGKAKAHEPTICYPANGWELTSREVWPLQLEGRRKPLLVTDPVLKATAVYGTASAVLSLYSTLLCKVQKIVTVSRFWCFCVSMLCGV